MRYDVNCPFCQKENRPEVVWMNFARTQVDCVHCSLTFYIHVYVEVCDELGRRPSHPKFGLPK